MPSPKIVVVGDSFCSAAVFSNLENLINQTREPFDLLFITNKNYYHLNALLPQYMANSCSVREMVEFTRGLNYLRPGISFIQTNILDIDFMSNNIKTSNGDIEYKYIILAPEIDTFEHKYDSEYITNINTLNDFANLKKNIIKNLDLASMSQDQDLKKSLLTFTILGSKEKDIELAFSISDFFRGMIRTKYTDIKKSLLSIELLEEDNNIELTRDPYFNGYIFYNLNKKNIKINTNTNVKEIDQIRSAFVLQTAIKESSSLINRVDLEKDNNSKAFIDLYLRAQGKENVFITGKASRCLDLIENIEKSELFYYYQSQTCANNILNSINNNPLKTLKIPLGVDFISLGSRNAIIEFNNFCFYGILPWFLYRLINIFYFINWKKKLRTFTSLLLTVIGLNDIDLYDLIEEKSNTSIPDTLKK